jgi:hypothetical protein
VSNRRKHFAQFAIAAFDKHNFIPGIVALANLSDARRRRAYSVGTRLAPLDHYAAPQTIQFFLGGLAGHFNVVGFFYS